MASSGQYPPEHWSIRSDVRSVKKEELKAASEVGRKDGENAYKPFQEELLLLESKRLGEHSTERLVRWAQHPDERVVIEFIRRLDHAIQNDRHDSRFRGVQDLLFRTAVEEANISKESWNPVLDEIASRELIAISAGSGFALAFDRMNSLFQGRKANKEEAELLLEFQTEGVAEAVLAFYEDIDRELFEKISSKGVKVASLVMSEIPEDLKAELFDVLAKRWQEKSHIEGDFRIRDQEFNEFITLASRGVKLSRKTLEMFRPVVRSVENPRTLMKLLLSSFSFSEEEVLYLWNEFPWKENAEHMVAQPSLPAEHLKEIIKEGLGGDEAIIIGIKRGGEVLEDEEIVTLCRESSSHNILTTYLRCEKDFSWQVAIAKSLIRRNEGWGADAVLRAVEEEEVSAKILEDSELLQALLTSSKRDFRARTLILIGGKKERNQRARSV